MYCIYLFFQLPIVIRVPRLNDPLLSCYRMEVDLQYPPVILGLGDIILPGNRIFIALLSFT